VKRLAPLAVIALLVGAGVATAQRAPHFDLERFPFLDPGEQPVVITGPIDTHFFGTFCQPSPKEFCKSVFLLPDPCVTLRDMRVSLNHFSTPTGGLLSGSGRFVLDGEQGVLAVAGTVIAAQGEFVVRGIHIKGSVARFAASAPGLGERKGDATLSPDGLQLEAFVEGRRLKLRKDACGNRAPVVTLSVPFGPTFPFGQSVMLGGQIDDEDTYFPVERLVFTSDRQGLLTGTRTAGGRTLITTSLQTGNHHITFFATDSGGLTGQGSADISVVNRPPETPHIFLPVAGATLVAEAPVLLQGSALDPDEGLLQGGALTWSAQLEPGGVFVSLGAGNEVGTEFAAPADPVIIRLTARDVSGQQSQAEEQVRVIAGTGNAPPVVVIREPDRTAVMPGPVVAVFFAGIPAHFAATAYDVEDAGADLQLRWEFIALEGPGGAPDPTPPVPNPAPVTGTLAPDVTFPVGPSLYYRVVFSATDSGGQTSSDSIEIWVTANVIL
jgi:hypothetical protein